MSKDSDHSDYLAGIVYPSAITVTETDGQELLMSTGPANTFFPATSPSTIEANTVFISDTIEATTPQPGQSDRKSNNEENTDNQQRPNEEPQLAVNAPEQDDTEYLPSTGSSTIAIVERDCREVIIEMGFQTENPIPQDSQLDNNDLNLASGFMPNKVTMATTDLPIDPLLIPEQTPLSFSTHPTSLSLFESYLASGSEAGQGAIDSTGQFQIKGSLDSMQIDGLTVISEGILVSDAIFEHGALRLSLTDFDPATGIISYKARLHEAMAHTEGLEQNSQQEAFMLTLAQSDGSTVTTELNISIMDDTPDASINLHTIDVSKINANNPFFAVSAHLFEPNQAGEENTADSYGADRSGATITAAGLYDHRVQEGEADGVFINADNYFLIGDYGYLTLNLDGSYNYRPYNQVLDNVAGLPGLAPQLQQKILSGLDTLDDLRDGSVLTPLQDTFSYTLADGDGDQASTTLTFSIEGAPIITDTEIGTTHKSDITYSLKETEEYSLNEAFKQQNNEEHTRQDNPILVDNPDLSLEPSLSLAEPLQTPSEPLVVAELLTLELDTIPGIDQAPPVVDTTLSNITIAPISSGGVHHDMDLLNLVNESQI